MCNAPATFQQLIEVVLMGLLWKECFPYIDDVLVSSPDFESHLTHLQEVFDRLRKAGLRLKTKKCRFLKPTVSYLGHLVTSEGIQPDPEKTSRVIGYPAPTDINEVRSFLGLASYYRRFVPGFAQIAALLHSLLKKEAHFYWSPESQQAFEQLKQLLTSALFWHINDSILNTLSFLKRMPVPKVLVLCWHSNRRMTRFTPSLLLQDPLMHRTETAGSLRWRCSLLCGLSSYSDPNFWAITVK